MASVDPCRDSSRGQLTTQREIPDWRRRVDLVVTLVMRFENAPDGRASTRLILYNRDKQAITVTRFDPGFIVLDRAVVDVNSAFRQSTLRVPGQTEISLSVSDNSAPNERAYPQSLRATALAESDDRRLRVYPLFAQVRENTARLTAVGNIGGNAPFRPLKSAICTSYAA